MQWFVFGKEPDEEYEVYFVQVWGAFHSEIDAKAFAIDTFNDNGWEDVTARFCERHEALEAATDGKIWDPYKRTEDAGTAE